MPNAKWIGIGFVAIPTLALIWLAAKAIFPFALGATVGAAAAYWYVKKS